MKTALRFAVLAMMCWAFVSARETFAQTNTPSTNSTPALRQVWDYAEELAFTEEQRAAIQQVKADYEAAQAEVRATRDSDVPPDQKRAANQAFAEKFRAVNRRIAEILTAEQKAKFAELRSPRRTAPASSDDGPEAAPAARRLPPRPLPADEELRRLTAELRAAYSKPSTEWPLPTLDDSVKASYVELGLLPAMPFPANNAYSEAKAELGKKLFFDARLSGSGQIACASCHDPDLAWGDGRTVSFGHSRKELKRNSPTLLNVGLQTSFFWDGRSNSLEEQIHEVLNNEDEMRSGLEHLRETIGRIGGYTNQFAEVFGTPEVTLPRATRAIATFVRTITSRASPFDAFLRGNTNALDDSALRGLHLFRTTARCANCHHGPTLSDGRFHDVGLSYYGRALEDLGRYRVTTNAVDVGAFRTPTLRNLARTAPYMHNGLFDLDGVLNLYNAGMPTLRRKESQKDDPLFPTKSHLLQPLGLNRQDLDDLKAFLESLTETRQRMRPPELPE